MSLHQRLLNSPAELTTFLESHGVQDVPREEVGDQGSCSLLIHAASLGKFQVVEQLLQHGADLKEVSAHGGNVLDALCFRPDLRCDVLEPLLRRWCDAYGAQDLAAALSSCRGRHERTPLMSAVFAPNVAVTQLLLRYRADAAWAAADGSCALDLAAQTGGGRGPRLVQLLLEAQADPNVGAIGPLFLAVQENDEASVRSLLAARARPSGVAGGPDTTPVECAARFGFLRVLKLLLAAEGAPRGAKLAPALKLAHEQKHLDVERILIKAGAADDEKLSEHKRAAESVDSDAQLMFPWGFRPGMAGTPVGGADGGERSQISVEELGDGCYRLKFQGGNSMTATAASPVRLCAAHHHFYFEVAVEQMDLLMAIGFARSAETPQETLPGWTPGTYGLHSDDGLLQANTSATRVMPGWKVKAGSTVGMGVQWNQDSDEYHLFVTLDGQRQSRQVPLAEDGSDVFDLWPLVGADRAATLLVNLHGDSRPFAYKDARTEQAMRARAAAEAESKAKRAR